MKRKLLTVSQIRSQAALEALPLGPPRPDIPPLSQQYVGGRMYTITHVQTGSTMLVTP